MVAFQPEFVERLRLAAYWSKRSVTALLEEAATQSLQAIEQSGGAMRAPDGRGPQIGPRGRWMPADTGVATLPIATVATNGDLFGG